MDKTIICVQKQENKWVKSTDIQPKEKVFVYAPLSTPTQPIELKNDVLRIKSNYVIRKGLDLSTALNKGVDLNALHMMEIETKEYSYLMQLIGYSSDGFCGLSTTSKKSYKNSVFLENLWIGENFANLDEAPIYLYKYSEGENVIISEHPPVHIPKKEITVLNNIAFTLPELKKKNGKLTFKVNKAVAEIIGSFERIFNTPAPEYSRYHLNTAHYETHQENTILRNVIQSIIDLRKTTPDNNVFIDSLVKELSLNEFEYSQTIALCGASFDEFVEKSKFSEKNMAEINKYAEFVKTHKVK